MRHLPADILATGLQLWLAVLAVIVAMRVLRGGGIAEMVTTRKGGGIDPDRVQSLLIFLFAAGTLIVGAFDPEAPRASLPDVPDAVIVLLAGSNGLYLAGKVARSAPGSTSSEGGRKDR